MSRNLGLSISGNPSDGYRPQVSLPRCPDTTASTDTVGAQAVSQAAQHWQLWQTHQGHFYRLCLRWMNGDPERADEALQLAAITIWSKRDQDCRHVDNPMAWLTGLVRHTCMDLQRARQRDRCRLYELDSAAAGLSAETLLICAPCRTPEAMMLYRELCAYLFTEIANLSERLRRPLVLRVLHGMPYNAIAQKLQLSPVNARKCVQEARSLLADRLRLYQRGEAGSVGAQESADGWLDEATLLLRESAESAQCKDECSELVRPRVEKLPHPTKRELQKLRTLRAYVQRHPSGWKKRLELADQLYRLGYTDEAIGNYRQVLTRQPRSLRVMLHVGQLLQLEGYNAEAAYMFRQALELASTTETQRQIALMLQRSMHTTSA